MSGKAVGSNDSLRLSGFSGGFLYGGTSAARRPLRSGGRKSPCAAHRPLADAARAGTHQGAASRARPDWWRLPCRRPILPHARARANSHRSPRCPPARPRGRPGSPSRGSAGHRTLERCPCGRTWHTVVADDPSGHYGRHAVVGYLLPWLPHKSRHRHSHHRPPSVGVSGKSRAGAAMLVVSWLSADARSYRAAFPAASGQPERIDRVALA